MDRFRSLLLPVWREVSQHLEIGQSAETLLALLQAQLPVESLWLHSFDAEHRRVSLEAQAPRHDGEAAPQTTLERAAMSGLLQWAKRGEPLHGAESRRLPHYFDGLQISRPLPELVLAPLANSQGPIGLLVLAAPSGRAFGIKHVEVIQALQEPFAAALENNLRLHELAALREAAEADRRSLLNRLGRKDLGDTIVGEESTLKQVMQRVTMVSRSDVPVLILGETGTGKELIARAIHNRSDRESGPFIRVNCGAIPAELIDSQLFGHERGAFTGASESRQGWFERADGGTLFLDEIGELPLDAQVRFLRVLQDGFVERVGGREPVRVDVRVVAATHRDLAAMVQDGRFREDLWYRIAVFPILLPPLRDRKDDIPELTAHFAQRAAVRFSLAAVEPTPSDIELLRAYHWPGNIRELGAVVDRAAILGDGRTLEFAAALGFGGAIGSSPTVASPGARDATGRAAPRILSLDAAMKQHIEAALRATGGKIEGRGGAAAVLEINPHTLRARMRKLGVRWQEYRRDRYAE